MRFRPRPATTRRLLFWLPLAAAALLHFASLSGRLSGDGASYYAQLRSLAKDGDIDLANEYAALGLAGRPELSVPTRTGLRRTVFSVGAPLLLLPFFALGEAGARLQQMLGRPADLSGYGPWHVEAAALGSLLYGLLAVWLMETLLRRHFRPGTARLAALLAWGATFLHWYMVQQPLMAHAPAAFTAALFLDQWDRRRARGLHEAAVLGLLGGLAMCVRWQSAVLLALPVIDLLRAAAAGAAAASARRLGALAGATLVGALPQMLVWHAVFGEWLLLAPPQGTDFVRLTRPFLLETLFSSRHGLLSWTPVLWAGYLGFAPLLRRRRALALPLLVPLLVLTYVNACSGDWWAGGSFSNRRFDNLLPVLAVGLAAFVDALRAGLRRRPLAAVAAVVVLVATWNVPLVAARARGRLPADDTASFAQTAEGVSETVAQAVGSPRTWPASWIFAARHGLPPARFDDLVGRYLFYRQNSQRGCVEPGERAFAPQLSGAWGEPAETPDGPVRGLHGPGLVHVGLDLPEDLQVELRARAQGPAQVALQVNGRPFDPLPVDTRWSTLRWLAPRAVWRRDLNAVGVSADTSLQVRALRFRRGAGEPPAPCGLEDP